MKNPSISGPPPPHGFERKNQLFEIIDIPIIHALYDIYKVWHKLLLKFPKTQRYSLGQEISQTLLKLLEYTLAASTHKDKESKIKFLSDASITLDLLKLHIRLAKDCKCISQQIYLELQSKLHGTGRMMGGWIKSL